jgi:hypothetical protein
MKKKEAIDNLYSVFRKYTTSNMHHCDCGCIDPDDVKRLASKQLRDLEDEDIISYHGSALYTWGDVEHYKHFLPRIFEIYNQLNGKGMVGLFEITYKLDYAKWATWDENEVKAIRDFIMMDWMEFVNERVSEVEQDDLEYYSLFFEMKDLMGSWNIASNEGLRNFVYFFYEYGTTIINKGIRIKEKVYDKEFKDFINQVDLIDKLEKAFFSLDENDNQYADKISIVLQMIEQEKAFQ